MKAQGFAAYSAEGSMRPFDFDRRELGDNDVAIDIEFCGVCHSDLHIARNEWGFTPYPIVLGHEIVGRVSAAGASARFAIGDRVGVGCMVDSCQACDPCSSGLEQFCQVGYTATAGGRDAEGNLSHGGFSDKIVVRQEFVVRLPDSLDAAAAAPLLCAGITTFSPLKRWGTGPGRKVAVVGLGGLGHVAIKFAKAFGAHVTVITSAAKKDAALQLGADAAIVGRTAEDFAGHQGSFDLILNTASGPMELNSYIELLRLDGTMVMLGAASSSQPLVLYQLESQRRSLTGSVIGGIAETQEMLNFCAEHAIACDIEIIAPEQIDEAFARMEAGDVKFRFVVDLRQAGTESVD